MAAKRKAKLQLFSSASLRAVESVPATKLATVDFVPERKLPEQQTTDNPPAATRATVHGTGKPADQPRLSSTTHSSSCLPADWQPTSGGVCNWQLCRWFERDFCRRSVAVQPAAKRHHQRPERSRRARSSSAIAVDSGRSAARTIIECAKCDDQTRSDFNHFGCSDRRVVDEQSASSERISGHQSERVEQQSAAQQSGTSSGTEQTPN